MDQARRARVSAAVAWWTAAVFASLSLWLWVGTTPDVEEAAPTEPIRQDTGTTAETEGPDCPVPVTPSCPPPDLAPLRTCLSRLEAARARLEYDHRPDVASVPSGAAEPAVDARVEALVEERLQARLNEVIEAQHAAQEEEREARWASAMSLVENELALSPEESVWMGEVVCAVRELRGATLADLARRGEPADSETWREIREEREDVLVNLETLLGPERYARFREIGGIGLLNDTLDCTRDR